MTARVRQAQPLVAVVSRIPLLCEALAGSLDGIAEVRRFRAGTSDTSGLLHSVGANAVVVDVEDEALAAAPFARSTGAPLVHVAMREQTLRVLDASGWRDLPGGLSVDAIRNVLLGGVYRGAAARGSGICIRDRAKGPSETQPRWLTPVRRLRSFPVSTTKRLFDLAAAGLALAALGPLLVAIAALVKIDSRGPVFFRQERIGRAGRPFRILKFRTMSVDAESRRTELDHLNAHAASGDARLFKIAGDPRVTRVGGLLRRRFLDELPQLVNVLRGEMSLVGPRPLVPEEDRHVADWARRRSEARPGITGLWQVRGGSRLSFDEMVRLDYLYVTSTSLRRDLTVLLRTVRLVLRGSGESF